VETRRKNRVWKQEPKREKGGERRTRGKEFQEKENHPQVFSPLEIAGKGGVGKKKMKRTEKMGKLDGERTSRKRSMDREPIRKRKSREALGKRGVRREKRGF